MRARWAVAAIATAVLAAQLASGGATPAAVGPFGERCEYVEAGAPGPPGNRLVIVGDDVYVRREGPAIKVSYRGPRCTGRQATVRNIDRIVVRGSLEGEGVDVNQKEGRFAPGATPEGFGSEIEFSLETDNLEVVGTPGGDSIRVRTLAGEHVALNLNPRADGPRPDYDVTVTADIPRVLLVRGFKGGDRIDARRLTGMGDNQLRRVIRLFGDAGDDTILGSPGSEWRLKDGPGDDLVVAGSGFDSVDFGRGRDTIYGGPGGDDLIYSTWERFSGSPPDAGDRIFGGGGEDQIIDLNRHSDLIRCGSGFDEVEREPYDRPAGNCERLR